jgi:hypothetical protein
VGTLGGFGYCVYVAGGGSPAANKMTTASTTKTRAPKKSRVGSKRTKSPG